MTSFNLTREPWIQVEHLDGRLSEMSTRDVLGRAHELRSLIDPSPLVVGAITRHLLAILHRSYEGPRSMRQWQEIASSGAIDQLLVTRYLDRWEERMDLLHPRYPFAQTAGLRERFAGYETPIDELETVRARWGGARELFQHRPVERLPRLSPARAARALLAHHAFTTGGLIKKPGEPTSATAAPLTRSALVIVCGTNLFVTLVANLLVCTDLEPVPTGGAVDACAWEQEPPPLAVDVAKEPKRRPKGYLDLLTWQSRRVQLITDNGTVTHFINAVYQGLDDESPPDPMVAYRSDAKRGLVPVAIDVERAFWRDAGALFETAQRAGTAYVRPRVIDHVASIQAREVFGDDALFDVEVVGQHPEKSKLHAVRSERVRTRARCFDDPDVRTAVEEALQASSGLVGALHDALRHYARIALAPDRREPDPGAVRALVDATGARSEAWSALGLEFEELVRALDSEPGEAARRFRARAVGVIRRVFHEATARADTSGRWLQAQASAEREFNIKLSAFKEDSQFNPSGATAA
jgi:CRISPR system Cascade subunit CasA